MNKRPLKITLDINSDEELRLYVREAIDNQVKSILRTEFKKMVEEHVEHELSKASTEDKIRSMLYYEIPKQVHQRLKEIPTELLMDMYVLKQRKE